MRGQGIACARPPLGMMIECLSRRCCPSSSRWRNSSRSGPTISPNIWRRRRDNPAVSGLADGAYPAVALLIRLAVHHRARDRAVDLRRPRLRCREGPGPAGAGLEIAVGGTGGAGACQGSRLPVTAGVAVERLGGNILIPVGRRGSRVQDHSSRDPRCAPRRRGSGWRWRSAKTAASCRRSPIRNMRHRSRSAISTRSSSSVISRRPPAGGFSMPQGPSDQAYE